VYFSIIDMARTMEKVFFTDKELAERWQLGVGTLRQWRVNPQEHHPKFVKIGGAVRYPASEIERFERNLLNTGDDTIDTEPTLQTAPKTLDDSVIDNWQGTGL
jgi:predicted DNA-binding transcriptional regulator AlpA